MQFLFSCTHTGLYRIQSSHFFVLPICQGDNFIFTETILLSKALPLRSRTHKHNLRMYATGKVRSKILGHIQQQRLNDASDQIILPSTEIMYS